MSHRFAYTSSIIHSHHSYEKGYQPNTPSLLGKKKIDEIKVLTIASLETAGSYMLEWIPSIFTLYFLGQSDSSESSEETGGYGLGVVLSNCLAIGVLYGLSCGLETLASHAYGAKNFALVGILYQRALLITCAFMVPIFFFMFFSKNILLLIYSEDNLCQYAGQYCKYFLPGIFFNGVYNATKCYLNAQNIYRIQVYTAAATAIIHPLWAWLFITKAGLGVVGAATGRNVTEFLNMAILFAIMFITNCHHKTKQSPSKLALKEWWVYLKVAIPIGCLLTLEWIGYEAYTIQASFLQPAEFAAHVINNNFSAVLYQFPYGCSIALTTFVGNDIGAYLPTRAKKFSIIGLSIISIFMLVIYLPFYFIRGLWADIFTDDSDVKDALLSAFVFYMLSQICDGYQAILTGIMRGIGLQNQAVVAMIICHLILGQTTAYLLTHLTHQGLKGIWEGTLTGIFIFSMIEVIYIVLKNWDVLSKKISAQIRQHQFEQQQSKLQSKEDPINPNDLNTTPLLQKFQSSPKDIVVIYDDVLKEELKQRILQGSPQEQQAQTVQITQDQQQNSFKQLSINSPEKNVPQIDSVNQPQTITLEKNKPNYKVEEDLKFFSSIDNEDALNQNISNSKINNNKQNNQIDNEFEIKQDELNEDKQNLK